MGKVEGAMGAAMCQAFPGETYSKEVFIAKWLSVCRSWRQQPEILVSHRDL